MAFDQGLSGLNAAATELDVIGNNIANSNTVGFKPSRVLFSDVYANALGGGGNGGGSAVGIGVSAANVTRQFIQGSISPSDNPLNIAINGNGFFKVSTNGSIAYTRNGQFRLNPSGAIVTANGSNVQGYVINANGELDTSVTKNLVINTANLPPKPTSAINTVLNLDSTSKPLVPANFNPADPATFSYSTSVDIYDSLGNGHALQTYYVNAGIVGGEPQWNVYASVDGALIGGMPATPVATFAFDSAGTLDPAKSTPATAPAVPISIPFSNGATTPQVVTVSYANTTQYGTPSGVNAQDQNGYASGQLTYFSAGADGTITGSYSNGQTQRLGQFVLNSFVNPSGLVSMGNNLLLPSSSSGTALTDTPGTGNLGVLQSGAIENSATDLTAELVAMITAQQNYQANAQTIKAANQISQTLVNLRN